LVVLDGRSLQGELESLIKQLWFARAKFEADVSSIGHSIFLSRFKTSSFIFSVNSVVTNVPFHEFKNLLSERSSIISFRFFSIICG